MRLTLIIIGAVWLFGAFAGLLHNVGEAMTADNEPRIIRVDCDSRTDVYRCDDEGA